MTRQTEQSSRQRRNGQQSKHEQLAAILQLEPVQDIVQRIKDDYITGRKGYDPQVKLACLLVMHLQNIPCVTRLVHYLRSQREMREACGITSVHNVPSEDAIYRFRNRLMQFGYASDLASSLVDAARAADPDMGTDVAVDSTDVDAWCNKRRKKDRLRDPDAAWGKRLGSTGEHDESYLGYKLHMMVCADTELPMAWTVTPANVSDSAQAVPVFEAAATQHKWFGPQHGMMDKGYDSGEIHKALEVDFHCHPVIPLRDMRKTKSGLLDENGKPCCEGGCWNWTGTDYQRKRSRWACPMNCSNPPDCAGSKGPKTCYLNLKDNYRNHSLIPRDTDKFRKLYNKRTSIEREFSRLKDQHMLGSLRVQGIDRATLHFELAIIARLAAHLAPAD